MTLSGAQPQSRPVHRDLVILVHGLTGAPDEMRYVAKKLAAQGLDVETPLLAGHGQGYPEVIATGWQDWLGRPDPGLRRQFGPL